MLRPMPGQLCVYGVSTTRSAGCVWCLHYQVSCLCMVSPLPGQLGVDVWLVSPVPGQLGVCSAGLTVCVCSGSDGVSAAGLTV